MLITSRTSIEEDGDARMRLSGERTDRQRGIPGGGSTEIAELLGGAMRERAKGVNDAGLIGGVYIDSPASRFVPAIYILHLSLANP
jgi:hypothetical protein